jgi:hypothetical protein
MSGTHGAAKDFSFRRVVRDVISLPVPSLTSLSHAPVFTQPQATDLPYKAECIGASSQHKSHPPSPFNLSSFTTLRIHNDGHAVRYRCPEDPLLAGARRVHFPPVRRCPSIPRREARELAHARRTLADAGSCPPWSVTLSMIPPSSRYLRKPGRRAGSRLRSSIAKAMKWRKPNA